MSFLLDDMTNSLFVRGKICHNRLGDEDEQQSAYPPKGSKADPGRAPDEDGNRTGADLQI